MTNDYEFWDLGDVDFIRMSDKALANVLRCLVRCGGVFTDSHEADGHYKNPNMNTVSFRVKLPFGQRAAFEKMSGLKLTTPPRVGTL